MNEVETSTMCTKKRGKKLIALSIVATCLLLGTFIAGMNISYYAGHKIGFDEGIDTITEFIETSYGITVEAEQLGDGSYRFTASLPDGSMTVGIELHLETVQFRDGKVISYSYHAMSLTNFGKDWIADNLANSGGTNVTKFINYIGNSNDSSAFNAAWTALPNEITTDGLGRALGTWADTTTGTWNMTKSFAVTGTNATKLYGAYIDSYGNWAAGGLVAAEQQGVGNQKNVVNGDTLVVTLQGTIS